MTCEHLVNGLPCGKATSPEEKKCRKHQKRSNFKLSFLSEQVAEKAASTEFLSLKDEVAMTRVVVEKIWNNCQNEADLAANANLLSKLFEQVEKLVSASHKMDVINGTTISEEGVQKIFEEVLEILTEEVEDAETLERISTRLFDIIAKLQK